MFEMNQNTFCNCKSIKEIIKLVTTSKIVKFDENKNNS